jgi:hypothetical protein
VELFTGSPSKVRLLVLPGIVRLEWKQQGVPNAPAYSFAKLIISLKSFIIQAPGAEFTTLHFFVTYECAE